MAPPSGTQRAPEAPPSEIANLRGSPPDTSASHRPLTPLLPSQSVVRTA